jgi:hypothetical protein
MMPVDHDSKVMKIVVSSDGRAHEAGRKIVFSCEWKLQYRCAPMRQKSFSSFFSAVMEVVV